MNSIGYVKWAGLNEQIKNFMISSIKSTSGEVQIYEKSLVWGAGGPWRVRASLKMDGVRGD